MKADWEIPMPAKAGNKADVLKLVVLDAPVCEGIVAVIAWLELHAAASDKALKPTQKCICDGVNTDMAPSTAVDGV